MRREIYWKGKRESSLWKMLRNYEDCIRKAGYLIQKYEQLEALREEMSQIYERTIREYEESEEIFQKKESTWNEIMQLHLDEECRKAKEECQKAEEERQRSQNELREYQSRETWLSKRFRKK